jgi:hypothetical protein
MLHDANQPWETQMRTMCFAIAGALILAGVAGWSATNTQARLVATGVGIDPMQIMVSGNGLPVENYRDYSVIFH